MPTMYRDGSRMVSEGVQFDKIGYLLYVIGQTGLSILCRPQSDVEFFCI